MWVLEIKLNNNYSKVADQISGFVWQPQKEFTGRKKQVSQGKAVGNNKFDDNVILLIDPREKNMQNWRKKICVYHCKILEKLNKEEDMAMNNLNIQIVAKQ